MATTHPTSATPAARPLPAHLDRHCSDRRQLLLVLLPALLALFQLPTRVRSPGRLLAARRTPPHRPAPVPVCARADHVPRPKVARAAARSTSASRARTAPPAPWPLAAPPPTDLQLLDAFLQLPILSFQTGDLRRGSLQGQAVLGDGLRLRHGVRRELGPDLDRHRRPSVTGRYPILPRHPHATGRRPCPRR